MIERKVIDKVVTVDGSMESVKDIAKLIADSSYEVEFTNILHGGIFGKIIFYQKDWMDGGSQERIEATYNEAGDYDHIIFHADGSINVTGKLPLIYEQQDKK